MNHQKTSTQQPTALIVGVANEQSVARGCAEALAAAGFRIILTCLNDKARNYVAPIADRLGADALLELDVEQEGALEAVFEDIRSRWGRLDVLVHSIAWCPASDLHGRVTDSSARGFSRAMDVSVHSFLRMTRLAETLMDRGGTCMTVSFHGGERVVTNYGIMGPVKAALESAVRYMAAELGPQGIRVHALSPGPMPTRAGSGIRGFAGLMADAEARAPTHRLATPEDVGALAVFLAGPGARNLTGGVYRIDGGYSLLG